MRVLVTGVAGFIGSHLAEAFVAEGHEVVGLDDLSTGSLDNLTHVPEVELLQGDLRDLEAVRRAVRGAAVILHHGAVRSVPRSMAEPGLTNDVNVGGTLNVLLAARDASARIVYASSSSVYGDQDRYPESEDATPRPKSPYAVSKLAGELYCQQWWRGFAVPTISLRYFNVYGPRQDPSSEYAVVVPRFITACLRGERPEVHGDGEQARDFTWIGDVVRANLQAATAGERAFGEVFNIAGGREPVSVNRLLATIAELTGTNPDPVHTGTRAGDVRLTHADISRARDILGYGPTTPIEEGLKATVAWFAQAD